MVDRSATVGTASDPNHSSQRPDRAVRVRNPPSQGSTGAGPVRFAQFRSAWAVVHSSITRFAVVGEDFADSGHDSIDADRLAVGGRDAGCFVAGELVHRRIEGIPPWGREPAAFADWPIGDSWTSSFSSARHITLRSSSSHETPERQRGIGTRWRICAASRPHACPSSRSSPRHSTRHPGAAIGPESDRSALLDHAVRGHFELQSVLDAGEDIADVDLATGRGAERRAVRSCGALSGTLLDAALGQLMAVGYQRPVPCDRVGIGAELGCVAKLFEVARVPGAHRHCCDLRDGERGGERSLEAGRILS